MYLMVFIPSGLCIMEASYRSFKLSSSSLFLCLKEFRRTLPCYSMREEILSKIRDNQVIVLVGETGCGKTTQVSVHVTVCVCLSVCGSVCLSVCLWVCLSVCVFVRGLSIKHDLHLLFTSVH